MGNIEKITQENWKEVAYRMRNELKMRYSDMAPLFTDIFPDSNNFQIYERLRSSVRRHDKRLLTFPGEDCISSKTNEVSPSTSQTNKARNMTKEEMLKALSTSGVKTGSAVAEENGALLDAIEEDGYDIEIKDGFMKLRKTKPIIEHTTYAQKWDNVSNIRFGIVSDTHINSKYTQLTYLNAMYDIFESTGVTTVYHCGDIDEGEQMRAGHQYECYNQGADAHCDEIARVYPKREGITTYFITGNHDASLIKRAGYSIGRGLANRRSDLVYLGADDVVVDLTPKCTMELFHPWDGSPYSVSYKPQKRIETVQEWERPSILVMGHYHKAEYIYYHGTHCLQAGSFEGKTPFANGKTLYTVIGGWICDIVVDNSDGSILSFRPAFYPFGRPIKDDYEKWR